MNRREEFKDLWLRSKIENYDNGMFEKKQYTKEEIAEKRNYFESQTPCPELEFTQKRWLYEIKRHFELSKDFREYPDASFAILERFMKFGH